MNTKPKRKVQNEVRYYFFDGLNYISESRRFIFIVIAVFLFFGLFAFIIPGPFKILDPILRGLVDKTEGLNIGQMIVFILNNNLQSAVLGFVLGIFFGIFPFVNGIVNGSVLGYVFSRLYSVSGFSEFWRILPHGIFELPAIFISLGLGVRLGASFFSGKDITNNLRERFVRGGRAFVLVVIPLLVIAAVIEGLLIGLTK